MKNLQVLTDYSRIPYYVQIKDYLLSLMKNAAQDTLIPGETFLADKFGVSRGTAKQAINDLVHEGRLYRVQGKGTFVTPIRIPRSFERLPTFTEDIRKMWFRSHSKVMRFGKIRATEKLQNILNLNSKTPLIRFRRLVELEDEPIVLVTSYLSPLVFPDLTQNDIDKSLYSALQKKYGKVPVKARDTYSIVNPSREIAEVLRIPEYCSIFYSERISYLEDMTPVEFVESYIRSDRYKLNISIGIEEKPMENKIIQKEDNCGSTYYGIGFRNIITQSITNK